MNFKEESKTTLANKSIEVAWSNKPLISICQRFQVKPKDNILVNTCT